jgi:large subunit ribosomal protein L5
MENPMRQIRIEKVTLNIGCGSDRDKLERAKKLLETITGRKVIITRTHKRTTFGMARKRPIGVKVTLRKKEALDFLKKAFVAVGNQIKTSQFDQDGNFSLGIKEYIDLPDVKYDPKIGILGMDVAVTLERPGYRVKRRKVRKSKIGKSHRIKREEAIEWVKKEFGVDVIE